MTNPVDKFTNEYEKNSHIPQETPHTAPTGEAQPVGAAQTVKTETLASSQPSQPVQTQTTAQTSSYAAGQYSWQGTASTPNQGTGTYPYASQSPYTGYGNTQSPYGYTPSYGGGGQPPVQPPHGAKPGKTPKAPKAPKVKKPMGKGGKMAMRVLCVVLCCVLVSGVSVASVIGLINSGYIQVTGSSADGDAHAAFTITKVVQENSETSDTDSSTVQTLSNSEIAEKVIPSVVGIENYQKATGGGILGDFTTEDESSSELSPQSEGSGVIATSDGYIITNAHVVEGADTLKVVLYDGTTYTAQLVGSDSVTDLALLKIDATGLTAAEFGDSDSLQVGDSVAAVGNPGGLQFSSSCTYGHISALNREITNSEYGYSMDCIQVDAAINPGNSGGALVNEYGQVVGITSSKIVDTSFEGIGFAIPVNTVQDIITDLMNYGYVKDRAMLGITGQYLDASTARFYGLTEGWYVAEVNNESAQKAGLQKGDVITKVNGTDVNSSTVLSNLLTKKKPGDTVTLTVYRYLEDKTLEIEVTLIESQHQSTDE